MALRMLDIVLPANEMAALDLILEDMPMVESWRHALQDGGILTKIVLRADQSESAMDALEQHFAHVQGFRVVLLGVEAVLPRPDEVEESSDVVSGEAKASPDRISRQELYDDIVEGARISRVYIVTVILSTVVATIGILRDDLIVLIGAMVIAPLLGPNVSLALATTLGDLDLARRSLMANAVGVSIALALAFGVGSLISVDLTTQAIQDRTVVGIADVALALAAGAAGALAYTRGVPASLVGVMVAVALLPPVVVTGILLAHADFSGAYRSFLLGSVNVICVNLAGVVTFLSQGIAPTSWWEANRAKRATRYASIGWTLSLVLLIIAIMLTS